MATYHQQPYFVVLWGVSMSSCTCAQWLFASGQGEVRGGCGGGWQQQHGCLGEIKAGFRALQRKS